MPYKKTAALLCFIVLFTQAVFAQQAGLFSNLQQYGAVNPQEKVYLHMDKPHYLTGDDIWIKGYVTLGALNQFSALSKILHVDLVDPANKVVSSLNLLILHGVSIGDMHLADTLQEGTYHIRAYTNWMRNLPPETFFNKAFTIGRTQVDPAIVQSTFTYNQTLKQLKADIKLVGQNGLQLIRVPVHYDLIFFDKTTASGSAITDNGGDVSILFNNDKNQELKTGVLSLKFTANNIDVQKNIAVNVQQPENRISFMPEGGDMVAGLQSRVAFKMLQPDGLGASGKGYITDDTGTPIVDFASGYAGMGSFYLTPQAGKTYKAVVTYVNGTTQTTNLPAILNEGYNLAVLQHMPVYVYLAIRVSPTLVNNQKATIVVQRQGTLIYTGQQVISSAESLIKLPLDKVPSGIIQVTLFNENMQAVCERLFFNLKKQIAIPLTASVNDHYQTRQPVTVTLKVGDAADSLRTGSFSVSVVNLAGLPPLKTNETGILPGLLLTPELKGYVERPDYYFEVIDNTRITELDNLILCQGWRRIVWDDIKAGHLSDIKYQPEKAFSISGTVTQRNGAPAANARVSLLSTKTYVAIDTVTDVNGHFVFDNLLLQDTTRLALRAKDADKHVRIKVDQQEGLTNIAPGSDMQFPDDMAYQSFLKSTYLRLPDSVKQRLAGYHNLKEVRIVSVRDKKKEVPAYSSNLNGPGNADQVFLADEMKNSFNLTQFLNGRVVGLDFNNGGILSTRNREPARIFLDGAPIDMSINDITVDDVQSIEILRTIATTTIYGPGTFVAPITAKPEGAAEQEIKISNGPIIIITTKTGKSGTYASKASPEFVPLLLNGYNPIRKFYVPDYSVTKSLAPDHRTTVYWKPDIITDKNGNASFKFYTTDDKGTYQLCIEGMTADGRTAHLVKNIVIQ